MTATPRGVKHGIADQKKAGDWRGGRLPNARQLRNTSGSENDSRSGSREAGV
jgi:hypothetical protein